MKAAVWNDAGSLDVIDRETPALKAGWLRLRIRATGICGTDLHFMRGGFPTPAGLQPGHEIAGEIAAFGEDPEFAVSTRVAVEPILACQTCYSCLSGNYNRCPSGRLLGVAARGGMAQYLDVPKSRIYPLPDSMSYEVGALCEPLAVCVRGVRLGGVGLGDTVVVLGAGSIGLLSIATARAAGATDVYVTARHPHQAAQARALGATGVFEDCDALVESLGESGADVVLETVGGNASTLADAAKVARPGAKIAMLGVFEGTPVFPALAYSTKELSLVASYCYGHHGRCSDFAQAVRLAEQLGEKLKPLVTHTFDLDHINEAFATALNKEANSIKVQVLQR